MTLVKSLYLAPLVEDLHLKYFDPILLLVKGDAEYKHQISSDFLKQLKIISAISSIWIYKYNEYTSTIIIF